jgi:DNA-binding transcriptional ArsR family regulator
VIQGPDPEMGEVPRELSSIVKDRPGIHFRELKRAAELTSNGQLRHHLDRLKREGVLVEIKDGGFKRFFIAGEHDPELRRGLARFARRVPRLIAKLLLRQPLNRTELRQRLDCADSTLGYHLNRMIELGDLERDRQGNMCLYSLRDPDFVRRVLHDLGEEVPGQAPAEDGVDRQAEIARRHFETLGAGWSLTPIEPEPPTPEAPSDGHGRQEAQPVEAAEAPTHDGAHARPASLDIDAARGEDLEVVEWPRPG